MFAPSSGCVNERESSFHSMEDEEAGPSAKANCPCFCFSTGGLRFVFRKKREPCTSSHRKGFGHVGEPSDCTSNNVLPSDCSSKLDPVTPPLKEVVERPRSGSTVLGFVRSSSLQTDAPPACTSRPSQDTQKHPLHFTSSFQAAAPSILQGARPVGDIMCSFLPPDISSRADGSAVLDSAMASDDLLRLGLVDQLTKSLSTSAIEELCPYLSGHPGTGSGFLPQSTSITDVDVHVMQFIGRGSFGCVYKGAWQGAPVAVKYMLSTDRQQLHISATEAVLSKALSHPNVVQTFACNVTLVVPDMLKPHTPMGLGSTPRPSQPFPERTPDLLIDIGPEQGAAARVTREDSFHSNDGFGAPYLQEAAGVGMQRVLSDLSAQPGQCVVTIVQEYCDRGSLEVAMGKGLFKAVALRALLRTAREVAQGMSHLHAQNIIHSDLKPANILLKSSRGDRRGFVAKVADFGLSKMLHPCQGTNTPCSPDAGTLAYVSPEVLQGQMCLASDVYSFGVILWQMSTGRPPFEELHPGHIMVGVQEGSLRLAWPDDTHPLLKMLGQSCLVANTEQRPTFVHIARLLGVIEAVVRCEGVPHFMLQQASLGSQKLLLQQRSEGHAPGLMSLRSASSMNDSALTCGSGSRDSPAASTQLPAAAALDATAASAAARYPPSGPPDSGGSASMSRLHLQSTEQGAMSSTSSEITAICR